MTRPACTLCAEASVASHHLTGRTLDAPLVAAVCHTHHYFIHDDWWTHGVGAKLGKAEPPPTTVLHAMYKRLRRLSMFLGRLAEHQLFSPLSDRLAEAFAGWADEIDTCIHRLDAAVPSWQSVLTWAGD